MGPYRALRPFAFLLSPESAHHAAMLALRLGHPFLPALGAWFRVEDPRLAVSVAGLRFPNPIGLAGGFDKDCAAVASWERLGFGFCELGTVTARAQPGNPKPRCWRYPGQRGLINRFGFNNPGAEACAARLKAVKEAGRWPAAPVGINIGKTKLTPNEEAETDYLFSLERLRPYADYVAVNVSSPNTPGLRDLQAVGSLGSLVRALRPACVKPNGSRLPLFVKLAPDLEEAPLLGACDAVLAAGADGLILTNTTLGREGLPEGSHPEGGLSGLPLQVPSDEALARVARHTQGRVPLIGSGGVFSAADARRKLDLGASLVQVYTGFIYEGPGLAASLCRGLLVQKLCVKGLEKEGEKERI